MTNEEEDTIEAEDSEAPVAPGEILAGKYRVEQVLGAGGMGVVVAAMHLELGERVAVKFLHAEALRHEEATQRFLREARAAVRIKSEHVARVIDVGRLESGAPYMVMEYLDGSDLSARVKSGKPISVEDAVDYVIQACDAMADAHALGIVHRDLKPANLFLTERSDGSQLVKVLDFGISKMNQPEMGDVGLTRTTAAMGSPLYMSPEQMRSAKNVDLRTDIWSLGAILYELLTHTTPFTANSFPELCAEVLAKPPRSLVERRPDATAELEAIIGRCLAKSPTDRFQSVAELAEALLPFAPRHSRASVERLSRVLQRAGMGASSPAAEAPPTTVPEIVRSANEATQTAQSRTVSSWSETQGSERGRRTGIWLVAGGALFAVIGVGVFLSQGSGAVGAAPSAEPASSAVEVVPAVAPEPAASVAATPDDVPDAAPQTRDAAPVAPAAPAPPAKPKATPKPAAAPATETAPAPPEKPPVAPTEKPPPSKNPLDMGLK